MPMDYTQNSQFFEEIKKKYSKKTKVKVQTMHSIVPKIYDTYPYSEPNESPGGKFINLDLRRKK